MELKNASDLEKMCRSIPPADEAAVARSRAHWDGIAKPLNGLGEFETVVARIAGLTGSEEMTLKKKAVVVFCADNGIVAEGVTQTDASVTAIMAGKIAQKQSSVCGMARAAGADVFGVDVGMLRRVEGVRDFHVADGTANMAQGPAMTREQALQAIEAGVTMARELREQGYEILATGEMGIGNTSSSAAVAAVLLGLPVEQVVGRGAGLSDEGLARKKRAVQRAIDVNRPDRENALDVLSKVGGFDIAGMVGLYLGGALYRVPVIIDGLISCAAALLAAMLCPNAVCAMVASHCSAEPAAKMLLERLGLTAVIHAGLKLGEGTGAVCMMPLLDMALSVYNNSVSFTDTGIDQYTPQEGK